MCQQFYLCICQPRKYLLLLNSCHFLSNISYWVILCSIILIDLSLNLVYCMQHICAYLFQHSNSFWLILNVSIITLLTLHLQPHLLDESQGLIQYFQSLLYIDNSLLVCTKECIFIWNLSLREITTGRNLALSWRYCLALVYIFGISNGVVLYKICWQVQLLSCCYK